METISGLQAKLSFTGMTSRPPLRRSGPSDNQTLYEQDVQGPSSGEGNNAQPFDAPMGES